MKFYTSLLVALILSINIFSTSAAAESINDWPSKPIRMVLPYAPGSSTDMVARMVAQHLAGRLGQSIVIENRGGAGGDIGVDFVAKAPPDGYTLIFTSDSVITTTAVGKKLRFDPLKDLTPIGQVATAPFMVLVPSTSPFSTLQELIDYAKQHPNELSYGTSGIGTITHLGTELFSSRAGIELMHIPYKGVADAYPDLIAGRLNVMVTAIAAGLSQAANGKVKPVAITSSDRSSLIPELPTASEAGVPGFKLEAWWGILGPSKLPTPIVNKINTELSSVLSLPELRNALSREGVKVQSGEPKVLENLMRKGLADWKELAKERDIKID